MPSRPFPEPEYGDTSYSPAFMTIDPTTGEITFDFDGHISARGIDLEAGTSPTLDPQREVRWISQLDGSVVAELYAYENAGQRLWDLFIQHDGASSLNRFAITAKGKTSVGAFANIRVAASEVAQPEVVSQIQNLAGALDSVKIAGGSSGGLVSSFPILAAIARRILTMSRDVTLMGTSDVSEFPQIEGGPVKWRLRIVTININPPSLAAHAASATTGYSLGSGVAAVGDWLFHLGSATNSPVVFFPAIRSPISTADTVHIRWFNMDTITQDPAAEDHSFLIINLT